MDIPADGDDGDNNEVLLCQGRLQGIIPQAAGTQSSSKAVLTLTTTAQFFSL